jgi:hypothetical protein
MSYPQNMTVGQIRELVENPGTPIRPPATAVMTIDSRDRIKVDPATGYRIDTTTPYEIYINKQQTLVNGYFTRIAMSEINMQWNTPNVIASGPCKNNTLLLEQAAASGPGVVTGSFTLTVLEGFYEPSALATVIQGLLNAGGGAFGVATWTCTYLPTGNKFVIADTSNTVFFRIRPQNVGFADDLCNLMGFSAPSTEFASRVVGSYATMIYTPYFDVVSDNLTKKQNVRDNSTSFLTGQNLLCRVYLSEPGIGVNTAAACIGSTPFNLYREYSTPKQIYWDTKEFINVIDLRLVDYKGRTLYSPPQVPATGAPGSVTTCGDAANFQLTLQVTET